MIRVFADDLTGAAELAGICKEHALDTLMTVVPTAANHAEAIVYCTDSRSMDLGAALNITEQFLEPISIAKEEMVYKNRLGSTRSCSRRAVVANATFWVRAGAFYSGESVHGPYHQEWPVLCQWTIVV